MTAEVCPEEARRLLRARRIDPIWRDTTDDALLAKTRTYRFLASLMKANPDTFDIDTLSIFDCRKAWELLSGITYSDVREWATKGRGPAQPKAKADA